MATYIRLTDYKSSEEKKKEFFDPKNRYEAKQEDFEKIPGSPIAYWVSDRIKEIFENKKIEDYSILFQGIITGDNEKYLRQWSEMSFNKITLQAENISSIDYENKYWVPYNKGGESRKWYGNQEIIVNFKEKGRNFTRGKHQFYDFFFKPYFSWTYISSTSLATRYFPKGFIWDVSGSGCFPNDEENIFYFLALIGSKIGKKLLDIINPTMNYQVENISVVPVVFPLKKQKLISIVKDCINISKEEWDSRETSWDFKASPLLMANGELKIENEELKMENGKIEDAYKRYCEYWREKFFTLHKNEEELNRLFIDIYELQDELTPDVELKDITILKNEAKIVDGELVFQADEIIKQFISYGVGVMFGRYSLDHEGLHIANMGESIEEVNAKFNIQNPTFEADDDNVIPVLEDDYFKDDIASRFIQFVKVTFGEENLSQNLRFIEDALKTTIRKYFLKGFYEDHIKRYKKRPIYWMVSSPKKGFMSLIYMHRYKPDTFARVRNSYLTEYIAKLEAHKETLALTTSSDTASNADKKSAHKKIKNIDVKLKEIIEFDRDKMMHFAQNQIEIDLDDGVKVNYCKFKEILYPITGLCK